MRHGGPVVFALALATSLFVACGSGDRRNGFVEGEDAGAEGGPGFTNAPAPCPGLECKRVACDNGVTTTLRGKVYDPAGANPLYNVQVYIPGGPDPNGPLPPLSDSTASGISARPARASSSIRSPVP